MSKTLITIMGACASGKSTLSRALLAPEKDLAEWSEVFTVSALDRAQRPAPPAPERVPFVFNPATRWAVVGNLTGGSDCVHSRAALTAGRDYLLNQRGRLYVMINSVRFSQQSDIFAVSALKSVTPVYVWFNLSEAENYRRLLQRRGGAPPSPHSLEQWKDFYRRNHRNAAVLRQQYGARLRLIELNDQHTLEQATKMVIEGAQ